jgi:hypothetical protein
VPGGPERFVIEDIYVSRNQLLIEERPNGKLLVKNLSGKLAVTLVLPRPADGSIINVDESREFDLPVRFSVGKTLIEITPPADPDTPPEKISASSAESLLELVLAAPQPSPGGEPSGAPHAGSGPGPSQSANTAAGGGGQRWSVEAECRRIRETLKGNHVWAEYQPDRYEGMRRHLLDPNSSGRALLAQGFHRVVVLDIRQGLDPGGAFGVERFLHYAVGQMVSAFDLDLEQNALAEDVFQILKDEPPSLFCFLNAHHISESGKPCLRAFTQELHQALMLVEVAR